MTHDFLLGIRGKESKMAIYTKPDKKPKPKPKPKPRKESGKLFPGSF